MSLLVLSCCPAITCLQHEETVVYDHEDYDNSAEKKKKKKKVRPRWSSQCLGSNICCSSCL